MSQYIEYLVIIFIIIGVFIGLLKGFVRIFFSWFSIFVGIVVALNFSYGLTTVFFPQYKNNIILIVFIGIVLFSLVYLIIIQISHAFSNIFQRNRIGSLDNLLGGVFGGMQAMIVAGFIVYWIMAFNWADLTAYPISMFSAYWTEKIITLIGSEIGIVNKLL